MRYKNTELLKRYLDTFFCLTNKFIRMRFKKLIVAALGLAVLSAFTIFQPGQKITIAAAADLKYAMDSIVTVYKAQNPGADVQVVYGSSGKFFEQISNDAPFDLFFSADMEYPTKLKNKNLTILKLSHNYAN